MCCADYGGTTCQDTALHRKKGRAVRIVRRERDLLLRIATTSSFVVQYQIVFPIIPYSILLTFPVTFTYHKG